MAETIYFDTCALNRLTDDQLQLRVRHEAEAVSTLLDLVTDGSLRWFESAALRTELSANPHTANRSVALAFLALASDSVQQTPEVHTRASVLQRQGFGQFDSVHIALAESASIDWLFTVDDRFLKLAASQHFQDAKPSIINPLEWVRRRSLWLLKP